VQNRAVVNNSSNFSKSKPKPQNLADPKAVVQAIWDDLPD